MLIKALIILLMFGAFIFGFSFLSEKDTLEEVEISKEFEIKNLSDWKLRLVENGVYELSQNSGKKINRIEFFTLDSLEISDSTSTKALAEKISQIQISAYQNSKLKFSNGFLEHLRNHKFYSLEEIKIKDKDWLVYSLHNADKSTSVWTNTFTVLNTKIFVFRFFYNIESLEEILSSQKIVKLLENFVIVETKKR